MSEQNQNNFSPLGKLPSTKNSSWFQKDWGLLLYYISYLAWHLYTDNITQVPVNGVCRKLHIDVQLEDIWNVEPCHLILLKGWGKIFLLSMTCDWNFCLKKEDTIKWCFQSIEAVKARWLSKVGKMSMIKRVVVPLDLCFFFFFFVKVLLVFYNSNLSTCCTVCCLGSSIF